MAGPPPGQSLPAVSPSRTPSVTPSISKTPSVTPSITVSPSITPSITVSKTPNASVSVTPSITPSVTTTPSITPTVTPTVTPSISITPSITPSLTISVTPSKTPTVTPTPSPSQDCSQLTIFSQMQQAALQFMQTDIAYYKHNLSQTKRNIYGESLEKWFYQPILIKCTIERDPDTIKDEMFGPDIEKIIKLTIPRMAWENGNLGLIEGKNVLPEIGDIFYDRSTERYYEL
jgi:hypothetical protein